MTVTGTCPFLVLGAVPGVYLFAVHQRVLGPFAWLVEVVGFHIASILFSRYVLRTLSSSSLDSLPVFADPGCLAGTSESLSLVERGKVRG